MRKIKRVLHVTGSLKVGGLENIATSYYQNINREFYEFVYVVFGDDIGENEGIIKKIGGQIVHIPAPNKNYYGYLKNLDDVINRYGPFDIVHSHTLFNNGLVVTVGAKNNIPTRISHSHSNREYAKHNIVKKIYNSLMRKLINKYSTDIVACSKKAGYYLFGEDEFEDSGKVVVNAIDTEIYKYNVESRLSIRSRLGIEDKFVLGHTGTFSKAKNHMFLLNLLKEVLVYQLETVLLVVGDGPEKENIIQAAKDMNLLKNILFVGKKSDVSLYLQAMDIFIFPSHFEGLGISLIEAQASGLPCLVSDRIPDEAIICESTKKISLENKSIWVSEVLKKMTFDRESSNCNIEQYKVKNMMESIYNLYQN